MQQIPNYIYWIIAGLAGFGIWMLLTCISQWREIKFSRRQVRGLEEEASKLHIQIDTQKNFLEQVLNTLRECNVTIAQMDKAIKEPFIYSTTGGYADLEKEEIGILNEQFENPEQLAKETTEKPIAQILKKAYKELDKKKTSKKLGKVRGIKVVKNVKDGGDC